MARIPDQELDRLKRDICVAELARARGIELKPHGQNLIGLCPFHDDREPSLVITPERNLWHCLGACQSGGSVVDWVMRAEGVSFRHAVELLRRPAGASTFALDGKGAPGKQRAAAACASPKLNAGKSTAASDKLRHVIVSGGPRAGIVGGGNSGDRGRSAVR